MEIGEIREIEGIYPYTLIPLFPLQPKGVCPYGFLSVIRSEASDTKLARMASVWIPPFIILV